MLTGPTLPVRIWAGDKRMSFSELGDLCHVNDTLTCDPFELHPGTDVYKPDTGQWHHAE